MIKLRPGIAWFMVANCAIVEGVRERANMPYHSHQESQAPQGPNAYSLSFAKNGASTAITSMNTISTQTR
jgi:hypothetical protein